MTQSGTARMLRCGDWKLVVYENDAGELYNLAEDPGERCNRIQEPGDATVRGDLALELARRLTRFQPANPRVSEDTPLLRSPHNWYRENPG